MASEQPLEWLAYFAIVLGVPLLLVASVAIGLVRLAIVRNGKAFKDGFLGTFGLGAFFGVLILAYVFLAEIFGGPRARSTDTGLEIIEEIEPQRSFLMNSHRVQTGFYDYDFVEHQLPSVNLRSADETYSYARVYITDADERGLEACQRWSDAANWRAIYYTVGASHKCRALDYSNTHESRYFVEFDVPREALVSASRFPDDAQICGQRIIDTSTGRTVAENITGGGGALACRFIDDRFMDRIFLP